MQDYILLVDNNCDLPMEVIEKFNIQVISMPFTLDGKNYVAYPDFRELPIKDFYDKQRTGAACVTAAANPDDFEKMAEPFLNDGKDILYIAFSSGLSGTINNAQMVSNTLKEKYPERKFIVVDSLAASMGYGLIVYTAALKKQEGMGIDELNKWVEDNRLKTCHWFTVNDLFHLKRGGRVSAAAAIFGSALGIKPVLHVDDEGHLIPMEKVRGRRQSLDALVKHMEETAINPKEQTVFISHGDALEDAQYVEKLVKEKLGVKATMINFIGPSIGAHSGAGTIALFFFGNKR